MKLLEEPENDADRLRREQQIADGECPSRSSLDHSDCLCC